MRSVFQTLFWWFEKDISDGQLLWKENMTLVLFKIALWLWLKSVESFYIIERRLRPEGAVVVELERFRDCAKRPNKCLIKTCGMRRSIWGERRSTKTCFSFSRQILPPAELGPFSDAALGERLRDYKKTMWAGNTARSRGNQFLSNKNAQNKIFNRLMLGGKHRRRRLPKLQFQCFS